MLEQSSNRIKILLKQKTGRSDFCRNGRFYYSAFTMVCELFGKTYHAYAYKLTVASHKIIQRLFGDNHFAL